MLQNQTYVITPYRTTLIAALLCQWITPISILFSVAIIFPLFDYNNIIWMNIIKHIGYRSIICLLICLTIVYLIKQSLIYLSFKSRLEIPLFLYLFSIINSIFWSDYTQLSFGADQIANILTIILLVGFFYSVQFWISDADVIRKILNIVLTTGFIITCLAIIQQLIGIPSFYRSIARLSGIFWDPNIFARYEVILLGYVFSILLIAKPVGRIRYYYFAYSILALLSVIFSLSRGGLLTLILMLLILFLVISQKKYYPLIFIGVGIIMYLSFYFILELRNLSPQELFFDPSNINRIILMKIGVDLISQHWFSGVGFGYYPIAIEEVYGTSMILLTEKFKYMYGITAKMHNWFIEVWAEQGLIGLLAFISIFFVSFRLLNRARKLCNDPWIKSYLVGHILMLSVFIIHGLFYHVFITQFIFWVFFSFAIKTANISLGGQHNGNKC